jgi:hypothetical protein
MQSIVSNQKKFKSKYISSVQIDVKTFQNNFISHSRDVFQRKLILFQIIMN